MATLPVQVASFKISSPPSAVSCECPDAVAASSGLEISFDNACPSSPVEPTGATYSSPGSSVHSPSEISESEGLSSEDRDGANMDTGAAAPIMVRETHLPVFNGRKGVQMHDEILRKALKALIDEEIPVVEYGSQILYRWGWAEVLMGAEWAVPDDLLTFASQTLADNGFPEASKPDCNYYLGGWVDLSRFHKDAVYGSMIYLYPLSVLGLTLEDTFEVPSTFDHKQQLLTPKPPRYMLSMIHHLVNSSVADYSIRHQVISDLAGFMHGYIFHGPPADTQYNTAEEEEAAEREFMEMVPSAIQEIRSWDWGDVPDPEYLDIAEKVVRDARELDKITKAVKAAPDESPANPSTATSM